MVCVSVCVLDTPVTAAKTEIKMSFGMWTRVGLRNHMLGRDPISSRDGAVLGAVHSHTSACSLHRQLIPAVDKLKVIQ